MDKKKPSAIVVPKDLQQVVLHACCAPCSSAIVEWMMAHGIEPVIFYYNPNIYPRSEYEIRRDESKRHAQMTGIKWVEGGYDHEAWRATVAGLEGEPERGMRCLRCFEMRLRATARWARQTGIRHFTTTLASSRWKSIEQIAQAGGKAQKEVEDTLFWSQNWRKGGLYERRNQLLKEFAFYNQQYCGCEFSMRNKKDEECCTTENDM